MKKIENFKALTKSQRRARRAEADVQETEKIQAAKHAPGEVTLIGLAAAGVSMFLWIPLLYFAYLVAALWGPWVTESGSTLFAMMFQAGPREVEQVASTVRAFFIALVPMAGMIGTFGIICWAGANGIDKFAIWLSQVGTSAKSADKELKTQEKANV